MKESTGTTETYVPSVDPKLASCIVLLLSIGIGATLAFTVAMPVLAQTLSATVVPSALAATVGTTVKLYNSNQARSK